MLLDTIKDCIRTNCPMPHYIKAATMARWMDKRKVIDLIFGHGGSREMIQRSVDFLKFMAQQDVLSADHIDTIWAVAETGTMDNIVTLYTALVEFIQLRALKSKQLDAFVDKVITLPLSQHIEGTIQVLCALGKCPQESGVAATKVLNRLWHIVTHHAECTADVALVSSLLHPSNDANRVFT